MKSSPRLEGYLISEEPTSVVFKRLQARLAKRGISWPPNPKGRPLHILYVSHSIAGDWERISILPQLRTLGDASFFFLKDHIIPSYDNWLEVRKEVDKKLPDFVRRLHKDKPIDLILSYLSGSQISSGTVREIGQIGIPTFSIHLDDRLFFRGYMIGDQWSGPCGVCKNYDVNLTNSLFSLVKYWAEGAEVIF